MWYLDSQPSAGFQGPVDGRGRRVVKHPAAPLLSVYQGLCVQAGVGVNRMLKAPHAEFGSGVTSCNPDNADLRYRPKSQLAILKQGRD